ncbi:DNA cytosine methyltransferase [Vibrio fluvialis]|nr:DNA cytosine methyltransferase [Vibrio fluvialis]
MFDKLSRKSGLYIDLFSGCGGLSLGLGKAGWNGLFAVEKDEMAFSTFKHNLLDSNDSHFQWPSWLPQEATTIQKLLKNYKDELSLLKGKVDLIAGGPPCQGFSLAGQRNESDPRNKLSHEYIKMVKIVEPSYLLLENVRGFNSSFKDTNGKKNKIPYSEVVKKRLERLGYKIFHSYVSSLDFGIPQTRTRFIMVGVKKSLYKKNTFNPFENLYKLQPEFLSYKRLPQRYISVGEAISDLEIDGKKLVYHSGGKSSPFYKLDYVKPNELSSYALLLREGFTEQTPNSMRLARHRSSTVSKFKNIQSICTPGISLNDELRASIGTKKQAITVLNKQAPSKTLTTLPDDILHYSEPRILTVREMARIQSFPDSFKFLGKYTTGGERRKMECPRYTQVGNAVPPLLGEALGYLVKTILLQTNTDC